jgi:hypothetical protein
VENKIPLPTDNIFKFYALFGLLLFIFSIGAALYENETTNEVIFAAIPELESLKQITQPSPAESAKIAVLQRRVEIAKTDRSGLTYILGGVMTAGGFLMFYGFRKWHSEVQPISDRMAKVQLEIAELQRDRLKRELQPPKSNDPAGIPE